MGKRIIRAFNIIFDTDGIEVDDLSDEYFFEVEEEKFDADEELADLISDETGWCVKCYNYEVVWFKKKEIFGENALKHDASVN